MICKKCGKNTVIEEGDHYVCTNCKARAFKKKNSNNENTESEIVEEAQESENIEVNDEENEQAPNSDNNSAKPKKSKLKDTLDFFTPVIIALIVAIVLKTFVFANAIVPTGSMLNTIQENDKIIASRLTYKFNDPERLDIIIFKYPDNEKEYFVKRIIGLPGETIQIINGVVYITDQEGNVEQLRDESYVTMGKPIGNFGPYVVPEDSYFVMGDNRNDSLDSRYWETTNYVSKDKIIGKVMFRYSPSFGKIQ